MLDATYRVVSRTRPFALVAPGFDVVGSTAPGGSPSLAGSGPLAPFAAVELHELEPGVPASAGLATPDGDQVRVSWDPESRRVRLDVSAERELARRSRRSRPTAPPQSLAFVLCERNVTGLVDTGTGWRPVLTHRLAQDVRDPEVLMRYRYAWQGPAGTVRAGVFGMAGLRDPHLVEHSDGTAYVEDGRVFLTWTCAGLGGFPQAHWSVWSHDPADLTDMRLEAHLFSRRGGRVLGDHAGQLVRDGDRWLVAVSSWGDFGSGPVHVRHTSTTHDLLRGVHVLDTEAVAMPTTHATWDPALTRVGGRWVVAFVESVSQSPFVFHPALASTSSSTWTRGLELDARGDHLRHCEGPVLVHADNGLRLLASDEDRKVYPVFSADGREVAQLDAPYGSNIPHPQVVPDPTGGSWLVTFDGTPYEPRRLGYGTHGDVVVMHSD